MITDRERFLALVYNGPLMTADAIVVLAGEDAQPRAEVAFGLFSKGAAPEMLVTGLAETDGHRTGADDTVTRILALGAAPSRTTVDRQATHTREQAERTMVAAKAKGWRRILLVASGYHIPRAALTFVKAAADAGLDLHIVPVPASHAPWFGCPEGMTARRIDLLAGELAKCERYAEQGDCATWADGAAYLERWEGR